MVEGTDMIEQPWRAFAYTGVFCVAIALLVQALSGGPLWANLAVSFAIGWSINLSFLVLGDFTQRWMSPYLASIPLTGLGLACGLIIGGLIIVQDPWFFFGNDYGALLLGIFFGVVGFAIFSTRGRLIATQAALTLASAERERQEKLLTQTELKLLQAQIEPHFLFNTLSNIAGLIRSDPDAAEQTLLNLTTLLRSTLKRTRAEDTTLGEELEIARAYLEIQAIRMQGRLQYNITSPEQLDLSPLPPLLVQPLIENAIRHGIDPCEDGGTIAVQVQATDAHIQIQVTDTGAGIQAGGSTTGTGTGLQNVRERLRALYRQDANLTLVDNVPRGMIATLTIPLERITPAT